MNREEFKKLTDKGLLFLDGATGSNLQMRGMPNGESPERWVLENPQVLLDLQKEYVEAGTNILYSCTFGGNRIKLAEYGMAERQEEVLKELVAISREAAGDKAWVAGDITMTGEQLSPIGRMDFEELVDIYKEQIRYMEAGGVDLLVVETMMSLQETRAAVIAAREVSELPIMVTMTFEADGRALFGTDILTAAVVLESLGADAFGINCSTGPEQMIPLLEQIKSVVSIPLIAKPNAGLPMLDEAGNTIYNMGPEEFALETVKLWEQGAAILGGCCGTTPEHIRALTAQLEGKQPVKREVIKQRYITSERQTLCFGLDDPFLVVGERINPTGKKKLQEELRAGKMDMVTEFAVAQEEKGAAILDVNMGMSGIDEEALMLKALEEVSQVTNLPLSIDSSYINVCEAALRRYPGRALLNSISMEKEKVEKLLPVARKYGAMFVLLPLSDKGIPETLEEKIAIIDEMVERALALGFTKEDIVVDGLVVTVGAKKTGALEALETIRYCKEKGLATTCGLSNISFGLPERSMINAGFLTMAIQAGLTMAIANPSQDLLMAAAFASDLLLNKEDSDIRYIEKMETISIGTAAPKETAAAAEEKSLGDSPLYELVLKGKKNQIGAVTEELLGQGREANELLQNSLLPAINEVGDLFDQGKYFLPQLINSAEAMKTSIAILQPYLEKQVEGKNMPSVVFATVQGDIHDIGKNLVVLMLRNYGFTVYDLGKDVAKEKIVATAIETGAAVIGLSALMTTTMQEMKNVISYAKEQNCQAKIVIGGAVITEDYQIQIGADGYAKDAADTVRMIKALLEIQD